MAEPPPQSVAEPAAARPAVLIGAGLAVIAVTYGPARYGYRLYLPQFGAEFGFFAGIAGWLAAGGSRGLLRRGGIGGDRGRAQQHPGACARRAGRRQRGGGGHPRARGRGQHHGSWRPQPCTAPEEERGHIRDFYRREPAACGASLMTWQRQAWSTSRRGTKREVRPAPAAGPSSSARGGPPGPCRTSEPCPAPAHGSPHRGGGTSTRVPMGRKLPARQLLR